MALPSNNAMSDYTRNCFEIIENIVSCLSKIRPLQIGELLSALMIAANNGQYGQITAVIALKLLSGTSNLNHEDTVSLSCLRQLSSKIIISEGALLLHCGTSGSVVHSLHMF